MHKYIAILFTISAISGFQNQKDPAYNPLFFTMDRAFENIRKDELAFVFTVKTIDTTETKYKVRLLSNKEGEPLLYFADIKTSVCADGMCKLTHIKVYWNLLGNYVGYGIDPKLPLTKWQHNHFNTEDYAKLHQLLLDDNSIFKRRKMSDLLDETTAPSSATDSNEIDAISGATKKEIEKSIVKGALYSCYTIWHIIHGEVKEKIKKHLEYINSDQLMSYFLYAPYADYQMYALKRLNQVEFSGHSKQIINIFKTTNGLTQAYVLKKIPRDALSEQETTAHFYNEFLQVDINTRTLLIDRLKSANPDAVEILSKYLDHMTRNQLKLYFRYLVSHPEVITKTCMSNLKKANKNTEFTYRFLIEDFFK